MEPTSSFFYKKRPDVWQLECTFTKLKLSLGESLRAASGAASGAGAGAGVGTGGCAGNCDRGVTADVTTVTPAGLEGIEQIHALPRRPAPAAGTCVAVGLYGSMPTLYIVLESIASERKLLGE